MNFVKKSPITSPPRHDRQQELVLFPRHEKKTTERPPAFPFLEKEFDFFTFFYRFFEPKDFG
jgi:hypothetical protein